MYGEFKRNGQTVSCVPFNRMFLHPALSGCCSYSDFGLLIGDCILNIKIWNLLEAYPGPHP